MTKPKHIWLCRHVNTKGVISGEFLFAAQPECPGAAMGCPLDEKHGQKLTMKCDAVKYQLVKVA